MMTSTLFKERELLCKASAREPVIVRVPEMAFVMIDGQGDPNTSPGYADAIQALYSLSYTLKFALRELGLQYRVGPLEGLWWSEDMVEFSEDMVEFSEDMVEFSEDRKGDWSWIMMIAQPDEVTPDWFDLARTDVGHKKDLPALPRARLQRFEEGTSAQILYIGPFSREGPTIRRLHAFIKEQGHAFDGIHQKHHEIYLSDPRRSAPERWKTIIRQPFAKG